MAAVNIAHMDEMRIFCSKVIPESKTQIHAISLVWQEKNRSERSAVWIYSASAPGSFGLGRDVAAKAIITGVRVLPADKQINYCNNYFLQVHNGEQDFSSRTPKASAYLRQYLADHPLSATELDQVNTNMGSSKQAYNNAVTTKTGFDLDATASLCQCLWSTIQNNTTAAERREEDETARAGRPLGQLPHMQRIAPLLAKCVK